MASGAPETSGDATMDRQNSSEEASTNKATMLNQQDSLKETQPGAKALTIIDMAELIDTSIMTFMATPPDQRTDLEAFLRGIQSSARDVRSLSKALIASEAIGQFVKFAKLPPEIRDKIWKHALEGLRIAEFHATKLVKQPNYDAGDGEYSIRMLQHPHTVLHVCHESRAIACKKYSLQLGTSSLANSRIDPKEDLVCVRWINAVNSHDRENSRMSHKSIWSKEALKLERIAIDSRAWCT